ncbi:MAG: hypothetical protein GY874_20265 [Desulfobacteraceae bacterium]|nr:hypothetical protein [Desulfobacteraceae bacterium]
MDFTADDAIHPAWFIAGRLYSSCRPAMQGPYSTVHAVWLRVRTVTTSYKYGPSPDDPTDHWYEFMYNNQTGAQINGNILTLHFADGQTGDDILVADGMVIDIGAPVFIAELDE